MSEKKLQQNANTERTWNAQRLYRYAYQLAQRLDLQLQTAIEWQELFDSETILLRQKLRETCEQLLFNGNTEFARRVEDLLWRKGFYDLIQKIRQDKKLLHSNIQLFTLYNAHLDAAHAFYHHLLFQIKERFDLPLPNILDWLGSVDSHKKGKEVKADGTVPLDSMDWAIRSCQRCLIFLGDIARYRMDLGVESALTLAERCYHQAIWVYPESGMPHNQLGTLKQQANYYECEVAYHYLRCLVSVISFDGAEENLKRTFERNRFSLKGDLSYPDGERRYLIKQFLVEFLELQENFRYERLKSKEFSKICQSVIEKFADVLNQSVENQSTPNESCKGQAWKFNSDPNQRISEGLMLKIFVICMITVSDLFKKNSEILSAAIAFTFTMLSKLLDFISRALAESPLSVTVQMGKNRSMANAASLLSNGMQNGTDDAKFKQRKVKLLQKYRRRRRRKKLSNNEDSEGENVTLNGKDSDGNESDSDLSEGEMWNQFLSSDENDREDDYPHENGEDEVGGDASDGSTDTESHGEMVVSPRNKITKMRQKNDVKKLNNLCEVGKFLSLQIQSTSREGPQTRNSLWRSASKSEPAVDVSLEASLNYFTEFCYLQTFKVMTDLLKYAGESMDIFKKDLTCVWQKIAKALNELPSHQVLLIVLQAFKRKNTVTQLVDASNAFSEQKKVLPEDRSMIGLPFLTSLHKSLDNDWDSKTNHAAIMQFVIRVQSLKSFGKVLTEKIHRFRCDLEKEKFHYGVENVENFVATVAEETSGKPERKTGVDGANSNQMGNGKNQNELMKAMAKQKLMHEVSELQDKVNSTSTNKASGMPPYVILDCPALCRHLSLIRSLAKSREFIMIVPIQTVQALDELKRYNPSAREAIKFLEEEFRQSSKWLRSQRDDESYNGDFGHGGRRKKNMPVDEWRFQQIIKCSLYYAKKTGKANMVSILTSRAESSGSLGTRSTADLLDVCRKNGIEVEPLSDFYQRWVAKKAT